MHERERMIEGESMGGKHKKRVVWKNFLKMIGPQGQLGQIQSTYQVVSLTSVGKHMALSKFNIHPQKDSLPITSGSPQGQKTGQGTSECTGKLPSSLHRCIHSGSHKQTLDQTFQRQCKVQIQTSQTLNKHATKEPRQPIRKVPHAQVPIQHFDETKRRPNTTSGPHAILFHPWFYDAEMAEILDRISD